MDSDGQLLGLAAEPFGGTQSALLGPLSRGPHHHILVATPRARGSGLGASRTLAWGPRPGQRLVDWRLGALRELPLWGPLRPRRPRDRVRRTEADEHGL